jgi:hypothetical protein
VTAIATALIYYAANSRPKEKQVTNDELISSRSPVVPQRVQMFWSSIERDKRIKATGGPNSAVGSIHCGKHSL